MKNLNKMINSKGGVIKEVCQVLSRYVDNDTLHAFARTGKTQAVRILYFRFHENKEYWEECKKGHVAHSWIFFSSLRFQPGMTLKQFEAHFFDNVMNKIGFKAQKRLHIQIAKRAGSLIICYYALQAQLNYGDSLSRHELCFDISIYNVDWFDIICTFLAFNKWYHRPFDVTHIVIEYLCLYPNVGTTRYNNNNVYFLDNILSWVYNNEDIVNYCCTKFNKYVIYESCLKWSLIHKDMLCFNIYWDFTRNDDDDVNDDAKLVVRNEIEYLLFENTELEKIQAADLVQWLYDTGRHDWIMDWINSDAELRDELIGNKRVRFN